MTKNVLKGVNFTNLKTLGGYIAKSKSQGVCLQLSQTQGVIMHFSLIVYKGDAYTKMDMAPSLFLGNYIMTYFTSLK